MTIPANYLRITLEESLTQFVWDQWAMLGGSGRISHANVPFAVDVEALILGTLQTGLKDPRLKEVLYGWLRTNGKLVSVQRLKSLSRIYEFDVPILASNLASFMVENGFPNWRSIATASDSGEMKPPNKLEVREMSHKPDPFQPQAFILKMRNFFGVNARAEIFTWLLTHSMGSPPEIARETGWMARTVQIVLNDLEESGIVNCRKSGGRKKLYEVPAKNWAVLNPGGVSVFWFTQAPFYAGCGLVMRSLAELVHQKESSPEIQAITIRERVPLAKQRFLEAHLPQLFREQNHRLVSEAAVEDFINEAIRLETIVSERSFNCPHSFE